MHPSKTPAVNTRIHEMWAAISKINFANKTVVDAGCGYGDLMWRIAHYGKAEKVIGFERDPEVWTDLIKRLETYWQSLPIDLCMGNLDHWDWESSSSTIPEVDFMVCCSVLPYLRSPRKLLTMASAMAKSLIIEVQFEGDGPGTMTPPGLSNMLLDCGWQTPEQIGSSRVLGREATRNIYLCQRKRNQK